MNRIVEVDEENLTATVEPGVITSALHREVEGRGLFYPPDPGSMNISTMGGNVAENSGGLRGLKYGVTADYVMGLTTVLADGELLRTGGKVVKDVAGYSLNPLLVSSEGTLGFFTAITVKLIPKPRTKTTMLAHFPELHQAALAVSAIIAAKVIPATLEFLDKVTIKCVEDYGSRSVRHAHTPTPRTRSGRAGGTTSGAAMCSSRFPFGMFHRAPGDVPGFDALIPGKPVRE